MCKFVASQPSEAPMSRNSSSFMAELLFDLMLLFPISSLGSTPCFGADIFPDWLAISPSGLFLLWFAKPVKPNGTGWGIWPKAFCWFYWLFITAEKPGWNYCFDCSMIWLISWFSWSSSCCWLPSLSFLLLFFACLGCLSSKLLGPLPFFSI